MRAHLVVIIYDSIENSVFESQVLKPLESYGLDHTITLISFEKTIPTSTRIMVLQKKYPTVTFKFYKRFPFITRAVLLYDAIRVYWFLKKVPLYEIHARGPFAGFIAQMLMKSRCCKKIMIQVRGLVAEEFSYIKNTQLTFLQIIRLNLFKRLEKSVYSTLSEKILFEAVSPALKEYMITTYLTPSNKIIIAYHDIPSLFDTEFVKTWRQKIRQKLSLSKDTFVYCYNGSAKVWQCPELVIEFFVQKYHENKKSFLLILTQDRVIFEKMLEPFGYLQGATKIISVSHDEVYSYLAASDKGLMFRKPHIINWVSRPTKMLEYEAIGLPLEHNKTVAWLCEEKYRYGKESRIS
jgi:hypothetical protein